MAAQSGSQDIVANKRVIADFFACLNRDGMAAAIETFPQECRWWNTAGTSSKEQIRPFVEVLTAHLAAPLVFEIDAMTAEEDRVAVEARSRGLRTNGVQYANTYHFLFRLRDGRIVEVREHCDTAHAATVWGDLA
jgi:ketosteroid isomerase-like protein